MAVIPDSTDGLPPCIIGGKVATQLFTNLMEGDRRESSNVCFHAKMRIDRLIGRSAFGKASRCDTLGSMRIEGYPGSRCNRWRIRRSRPGRLG